MDILNSIPGLDMLARNSISGLDMLARIRDYRGPVGGMYDDNGSGDVRAGDGGVADICTSQPSGGAGQHVQDNNVSVSNTEDKQPSLPASFTTTTPQHGSRQQQSVEECFDVDDGHDVADREDQGDVDVSDILHPHVENEISAPGGRWLSPIAASSPAIQVQSGTEVAPWTFLYKTRTSDVGGERRTETMTIVSPFLDRRLLTAPSFEFPTDELHQARASGGLTRLFLSLPEI